MFYKWRKTKDKISNTKQFLLKNRKVEKLHNENVITNGLEIGHYCMQGFRVSMEDEYTIEIMKTLSDHALVAILDGWLIIN